MSGGGSGGGGSTTNVTQNYSPEEAARRANVMNIAESIYGRTANQIASAPYPGAQPVARDPMTAAGQQYAVQQAQGPLQSITGQAQNAASFGLGPALYAESNPYLQSYMAAALRPATQAFTEAGGPLSQIRSSSMGAGQDFGGTRQGIAEGLALGRFGQGALDTTANIANQGYAQGLSNMSRTMMFLPQIQQMALTPGQIMESVGLSNEQLAQEQEQYNAAAREWGLTSDWRALQPYANMVYGQGPTSTSTNSQFMQPQRNQALGALGGAASGAAVGSMIAPGYGTAIGALAGLVMGLM